MSAASQRGDYAEVRAAARLGVARVGGSKKRERVPDTLPVRLSDGRLLQPEVKARKHLPKALTNALEQARRYAPTSEPLAVFFAKGERKGIVVLDLDFFIGLVGIREPIAKKQLELLLVAPAERAPRAKKVAS